MIVRPTRLFLTPEGHLGIDWSDGQRRLYSVEELRLNCPCAACESRKSGRTPPPPQVDPDLAIRAMDPVGGYGYKIRFSDGHDTGIFTIELLHELGTPAGP